MNKNDTIKFRVDSSLKQSFKGICEKKGKTMSELFEEFMKKIILDASSK
ncbi:type II toxin-antitoxin system RelB/DinJ family antitoxin [Clostridium sp. UBA1056]